MKMILAFLLGIGFSPLMEKLKLKEKMCPECNGFGWTNKYDEHNMGNGMSVCNITSVRCPDCDGLGTIKHIPLMTDLEKWLSNLRYQLRRWP